MSPNESSFRYPWEVRSVAELRREMDRAFMIHGRISLCGWVLKWLDPPVLVRWDGAKRIVAAHDASRPKSQNRK